MMKTLLLLATAGLSSFTAQGAFTIRVPGGEPFSGVIIAGKDYVPLAEVADRLGAKVTAGVDDAGKREITLTPGAGSRKGFDDSPDTTIELDGDTSLWAPVANSSGKLRVRDFYRRKESWVMSGELEVAAASIRAEGREPRNRMILYFYVTLKDAQGKTVGRLVTSVQGVSYDGGRYPLQINTENSSGVLPKSVTIRFTSAEELDSRMGG